MSRPEHQYKNLDELLKKLGELDEDMPQYLYKVDEQGRIVFARSVDFDNAEMLRTLLPEIVFYLERGRDA